MYPKRYKSNINKALNSGVPVKTIEPTILFGGISLLTLIVLNIVLLVTVTSMQDNIQSLQNNVLNLNNRVWSIQSSVSDTNRTIDEMYQDTKWIKSGEYTIEAITDDSLIAEVLVVFEMNRIPSGASITLLYTDEDNNVLMKEISSETTIFSTNLTVDATMDYELSVMIDDGVTVENEDLMSIYINSRLRSFRTSFLDFEEFENYFKVHLQIRNDYSLNENFEFEEVIVKILVNGTIEYTDTITVETSLVGKVQIYEIALPEDNFGEGTKTISVIGIDKLGNQHEFFNDEESAEFNEIIYYEYEE